MKIVTIPLDRIAADDRLRIIDADYVALIAASIEEVGLMTPIEVRELGSDGRHALISGGHRLAAMEKLGRKDIPAIVFKGNDLDVALREIDENLFRHDLNELDRSAFLARRKAVYEQLHPEVKHGANGVGVFANSSGTLRFTADAAKKLGLSESRISRLVRRYTHIPYDIRQRIAGTKLARTGSELDALAKLPAERQRAVVDLIQEWPDQYRTVADAERKLSKSPKSALSEPDQQFQRLTGCWRKSGEKARQRFIDYLTLTESERMLTALKTGGVV